VPTVDPFSFTAHGHPWVVQSWLVSVVFGAADELAGGDGVRVAVALLTVGVFAVAWRLSRPAQGLLVRVGIAGLVLGVGAYEWSERPLLVGLLALGLTVLAGEGELDPRWLLPLGWIWVNSHGSFPLGVVYLLVVALGRRLDRLDASVELRALRWLVGGLLVGAANPLGPRLLLFPAQLLRHQEVLRNVIEWQAPTFTGWGQRIFLLQVGLAILAVVRRPRYRTALVVAVFVAAALLGARNVGVASLVLVPVLAEAWPSVGTLRSGQRGGPARLLSLAGLAAVAVVAVAVLGQPSYDLGRYPVRTLDQLADWHVDLDEVRLASIDRVGNLIELREGEGRSAFFDDRFDMYPEALTEEVSDLASGHPRSLSVLERWRIQLVLWPRDEPLTAILREAGTWRAVHDPDPDWVLFCRAGTPVGDRGTC
jgi:hypothetical protein